MERIAEECELECEVVACELEAIKNALDGGQVVGSAAEFIQLIGEEGGEELAEQIPPPEVRSRKEKALAVDGRVCDAPFVGMVCKSIEELEAKYMAYGEQQGFGVVRGFFAYKQSKNGLKVKRCLTWRCECYGKKRRNQHMKKVMNDAGDDNCADELELQSSHLTKKCGCPAYVYGVAESDGTWVVRRVEHTHQNHNPTPSKSASIHLYRIRKFHHHLRRRVMDGAKAGISIRQVFDMLLHERSGVMPITQRDMRNIVDGDRRTRLKEGDGNVMWAYFMRMYADNPNFFHEVRVHESGVLKDVLWIDARSRAAYEEFGDVVCFDTTYLTNEYDLPFANFVGVNHHGQTILLGCALVSNETIESFEWVFKTWLKAMGNIAPQGILTDQAQAMKRALENTMPQTRHRWCLWHIMKKWPIKLGQIYGYDIFGPLLKSVIYDSLDGEEFESRWLALVNEHRLGENEWLSGLYKEREMWVPAYTKHLFWVGMRSTQRVESIHAFFDSYLNKHTRLFEFVESYVFAMESRCKSEKDADDHCARYTRSLHQNHLAVEKTFQSIYTDDKFREVQIECQRCGLLCGPTEKVMNDDEVDNIIQDRVYVHFGGRRDSIATEKRRNYVVRYNKKMHDVSCECKLFDCSGILCRHIVRVLDYNAVTEIPEKYILRRWRKDITRKHTLVKVAYHDPRKVEEVRRYDKLNIAFEPVAVASMLSDRACEVVIGALSVLHNEVAAILADDDRTNIGDNNTCPPLMAREESSSVGIYEDVVPLASTTATNTYHVLNASSNVQSLKAPTPRHQLGRVSDKRRKSLDEVVLKKAQKARLSGQATASGNTSNQQNSQPKPKPKARRQGAVNRNKGPETDSVNNKSGPCDVPQRSQSHGMPEQPSMNQILQHHPSAGQLMSNIMSQPVPYMALPMPPQIMQYPPHYMISSSHQETYFPLSQESVDQFLPTQGTILHSTNPMIPQAFQHLTRSRVPPTPAFSTTHNLDSP